MNKALIFAAGVVVTPIVTVGALTVPASRKVIAKRLSKGFLWLFDNNPELQEVTYSAAEAFLKLRDKE